MLLPVAALMVGAGPMCAAESYLPPPNLNLVLEAPIESWDEAIPLGNGLMGGLLWGEGATVRLSLDRGDLWDLRPPDMFLRDDWTWATLKRQVAEGDFGSLHRMFDDPYGEVAHPTKIPAGRLEISLAPGQEVRQFVLDLASAEGRAELADGKQLTCFYSATEPVALLRVGGPEPRELRLSGPASVAALGYPPATVGEDSGARWYVQEGAHGLRYVGMAASRRVGDATLIAVAVTTSRDAPDPVALARRRTEAALSEGYEAAFGRHRDWWSGFWAHSRVEVPDRHILQHYYLIQYFYGAASRMGAPPIPLQGVWTADEGGLPPWKGDYHNDLNTQTTYIGYLTSGRFEEGECFLELLWQLLPSFREFARSFYGTPGAMVPGVMGLDGQPLGGWAQYTLTPGNAGWLAWMFAEHWRYTRDERFLRERAYPWCSEVAECMLALLQADEAGALKLPLSSSPEIHDNSPRAWLKPNSNYDQACLLAMFASLAEMADALSKADDAARWRRAREALGGLLLEPDTGVLMYARDEPVAYSHRHLSHSMAVHPFNLINVDGGEADRRTVAATCERYDQLGTAAWCGYSFSWMSCLRARVGDAEAAYRNLDIFVNAFVLRNGFHVNGDQTGMGFSSFTYRPFTLEGNFLATQAVHEMLLQSWGPRPGTGDPPVIRLFPATPWRWHEASFDDLRAEGGHRVSARRVRNGTVWFRIVAGSDGPLRIRDNFGGRVPQWNREDVRRAGRDFEVAVRAGEGVEATLPAPEEVPPPPPGVAEPVKIERTAIKATRLPLRIGADSAGDNRFAGQMIAPQVYRRALSAEEIAALAQAGPAAQFVLSDCLVDLALAQASNGIIPNSATPDLPARLVGDVVVGDAAGLGNTTALVFGGNGHVEIADDRRLDCPEGVSLAAWVRAARSRDSGARILDKSPVGVSSGYMMDTFPGSSLRMVTVGPNLGHAANLPLDLWTHVAATADGATGRRTLYVNGKAVASDRRSPR